MKKAFYLLIAAIVPVILSGSADRNDLGDYGFKHGTPEIQSISALAFSPEGVLFIGDSRSAKVFAIDTRDKTAVEKAKAVELNNVDKKIAAVLGTDASNITIQDIAVHPVSRKIFCAVQSGDGTPVLLTVDGENFSPVSLKDVPYSVVAIGNAPAADARDQRGRPLRVWAISDMNFADGKLLVSGLSNQEFSSTFRSIPFPFTGKEDHASLEIYHAAHGRYETYAPIRTFTTADLNGKKYLVASYTCTPLVLFPLDELKAGKLVRGRTVAEFGAGNTPLDIITMKKGDESYLIMANSSRPVMRVRYRNIETYEGTLTEPVEESFATAGVDFVNLPVVNALQLDKLDDTQMIVLQRRANGDLDLWTATDRWL